MVMQQVNEQNEWLQQEVAELEKSYHDLEVGMDPESSKVYREEQSLDQEDNNNLLVPAQQVEKLESFFEKPEIEEGHQTKKLLEYIIDLAGKYVYDCTYLEVMNNVIFSEVIL
ncbi:hypothetical protein V6N12_041929 [Hibiscus sabdariffa]|uniref:Uncharacterized protein n=1 Tax=Hibiscus sabdariffa TaxID=183260 RepID=A0ABR2EDR4_9ROSI